MKTLNFDFKKLLLDANGWALTLELSEVLDVANFRYWVKLEYDDSGLQKQIAEAEEKIEAHKNSKQLALMEEDSTAIENYHKDIQFIRTQIKEAQDTYESFGFGAVVTKCENRLKTTLTVSVPVDTAIWIAQHFEDLDAYRAVLEDFVPEESE